MIIQLRRFIFPIASNGAHEWLIEFEKEPESLDAFTKELDTALKNINSDYEAKRHKNIALRLPVIHSLKKELLMNGLEVKENWAGSIKCQG